MKKGSPTSENILGFCTCVFTLGLRLRPKRRDPQTRPAAFFHHPINIIPIGPIGLLVHLLTHHPSPSRTPVPPSFEASLGPLVKPLHHITSILIRFVLPQPKPVKHPPTSPSGRPQRLAHAAVDGLQQRPVQVGREDLSWTAWRT